MAHPTCAAGLSILGRRIPPVLLSLRFLPSLPFKGFVLEVLTHPNERSEDRVLYARAL